MQKLKNSIQTLIILWPFYPIHTNSLFWVIFEKLPFCHFLPPNTSIRGKDSQFHCNLVDLLFEYVSFSNKRKTTILLVQNQGKCFHGNVTSALRYSMGASVPHLTQNFEICETGTNGTEISWEKFQNIRKVLNFRKANHSTENSGNSGMKVKWN